MLTDLLYREGGLFLWLFLWEATHRLSLTILYLMYRYDPSASVQGLTIGTRLQSYGVFQSSFSFNSVKSRRPHDLNVVCCALGVLAVLMTVLILFVNGSQYAS